MAMYPNMQPVHSDNASNTVVMADPESVVAKITNVLPITVFVHYISPLYSYLYYFAFKKTIFRDTLRDLPDVLVFRHFLEI